jgi:hypothetical protein
MIDVSMFKAASAAIKANGLAIYETAAPGQGGMSPAQRVFHASTHPRRLLIGGNQIGKSRSLCAESLWSAGVRPHPFRDTPEAPNIGWVMCADLKGGWQNWSQKCHEIMPPGAVAERCFYDSHRGYTRGGSKMIELANGSIIVGKSGSQDQISLSGGTVAWGIIDEIPKQSHWGEFRTRLAALDGMLAMGLTPVGRPAEYLRDWVEGSPDLGSGPMEDWDVQRVKLTPENVPHRTAESIATQIAAYGPFEFAQRVEAAWEGITTDAWIAFSEENIFDENDPPQNIEAVGLGWDHGEKPGNSVCYLTAWSGSKLYVLDGYVSKERNTPKVEAKEIQAMLANHGINLHQIDEARGDSNSSGRMGLGFSVNSLLERAFADLLGQTRAPFEIKVPWKGSGSIKARARLLSHSCLDGTFNVSNRCTHLISALRHWRGESASDLKHHFDGCGYISEVYLTENLQNSGYLII